MYKAASVADDASIEQIASNINNNVLEGNTKVSRNVPWSQSRNPLNILPFACFFALFKFFFCYFNHFRQDIPKIIYPALIQIVEKE